MDAHLETSGVASFACTSARWRCGDLECSCSELETTRDHTRGEKGERMMRRMINDH